ncbi:MAG: SPFH domain-containing protein [Gammaproteobacteria bacterium]|nr:SPFH domain-containing protein [Gammaproteobacteria bacterium]
MKRRTRNFLVSTSVIVVILVGALLYDSFYVIEEGHEGILLRFGEVITKDESIPPGLHRKMPISDDVKQFKTDAQLYEFSQAINGSQVLTVSVKWRVTNPYVFYVATAGDIETAQLRLQARIFRSFQESRQIPLADLSETLENHFGIVIVELLSEVQDSS